MSKISELSDGGSLQSTDYLIAVRSGGNVKVRPNGAVSGTTGQFSTSLNVDGTVTAHGLKIENSTAVILTLEETGVGTFYEVVDGGNYSLRPGSLTTTALRVASNGDLSLYEDTGTTPKFFWDASAERLGLGTSSPAYPLTVQGLATRVGISDSGAAELWSNTDVGGFVFRTHYGLQERAGMYAVGDYASQGYQPNLTFRTNATDRITILGTSGNVGIGTSSPSNRLSIAGDMFIQSSATGQNTVTIRQLASQTGNLTQWQNSGGTVLNVVDSAGNVGIGTTSPANGAKLHSAGAIISTDATLGSYNFNNAGFDFVSATKVARFFATSTDTTGGVMTFITGQNASYAERMRIDSSGNVGIGEPNPAEKLEVAGNILLNASNAEINLRSGAVGTTGAINWTFNTDSADFASIKLPYDDRNTTGLHIDSGYPITIDASGIGTIFAQSGSEKARLDASGNLLVGTTSTSASVTGARLFSTGRVVTSLDDEGHYFRRNNTDGTIVEFAKDGTTVGSIGAVGGSLFIASPQGTDAGLQLGNSIIAPAATTGAIRDAAVDLGWASNRFKDLYLSGGVYVGGTGAGNKLDYYEQGTFSPTLRQATTDPTGITYTQNAGYYIRVGDVVFVRVNIVWTALTAGTGQPLIGNLPFAATNSYSFGFGNFGSQCVTATGISGTDSVSAFARADLYSGFVASLLDIAITATVGFNSSGRIDMGFCYQAA